MVDNVGWKMRGIDLPIRITNVPFGTVRKTGQKKKSLVFKALVSLQENLSQFFLMPPGGAQLRPRTRWSGCISTLAQKRLGINQSQSSGNLRQISKNPKLVLKNLTQSLRHKRQS